jgi:uncharacterized membrane protein
MQSIPKEAAMIKTMRFAVMHFSVAFGVTYALRGDLVVGGLVALVEPAVNMVAYYFHEKLRDRVHRGEPLRQSSLNQGCAPMSA